MTDTVPPAPSPEDRFTADEIKFVAKRVLQTNDMNLSFKLLKPSALADIKTVEDRWRSILAKMTLHAQ